MLYATAKKFETDEELHERAMAHPETFDEDDVYILWMHECPCEASRYDHDDYPDFAEVIDEWFFHEYGTASYMDDDWF